MQVNIITLGSVMFLLFIDEFHSQPIEPATKTTKGRRLLTHDGYEYRVDRISTADENLIFWRCIHNWCPGRVHENTATSTITVKGRHKHMRSQTDIEVRARKEMEKDLAKIPLPPQDLPPKIIYSMATQGLTGEALHAFHSADASRKTVDRMRSIPKTAHLYDDSREPSYRHHHKSSRRYDDSREPSYRRRHQSSRHHGGNGHVYNELLGSSQPYLKERQSHDHVHNSRNQ